MGYLLINKETKIAENAVAWDGDTSKWMPPETHFAVAVATAKAVDWVWDEDASDWVAIESVGCGGIGDIWDGEKLVQPKPSEPPVADVASQDAPQNVIE